MSFVAADGTDTDVANVHNFRWMRCASQEDTLDLIALQPWMRKEKINDRWYLWYPEVLALAAE